jgi:hypothetical protein
LKKAQEVNEKELGFVNGFLEDCNGMTEEQLADMMLEYYEQNPDSRRGELPSVVLTIVIPRLKKGLSPYGPIKLRFCN